MKATSTGDKNIPRVVAVVAMGPSHRDYISDCIAKSGRYQVADETWVINAMGGIIEHDCAFIMDDLSYFAKASREHKHLEGYKDWLHKHPGPIYTSRVDADFPGSLLYPLEEVLNSVGFAYFNTTVAYALAFAIHLKVPHVKLYGMDFTQKENRGVAEAGRACVEYWIAVACSRGMKIELSRNTSLCDHDQQRPLYGYSTAPKIRMDNGIFKVDYA